MDRLQELKRLLVSEFTAGEQASLSTEEWIGLAQEYVQLSDGRPIVYQDGRRMREGDFFNIPEEPPAGRVGNFFTIPDESLQAINRRIKELRNAHERLQRNQ